MVDIKGLSAKLHSLKDIVYKMKGVVVAYSGGVDSTFLLAVVADILEDNAIAVTAHSEIHPMKELEEARTNAKMLGVKHIVINTRELDDENFTANPPERCYYCKRGLFARLAELASRYKLDCIADGTNYDDFGDFRPGMRAAAQFGIRSPLQEAGFTKQEIRALSREMNVPAWDRPAQPCLATRFPYGTTITREQLARVDRAEQFLAALGIKQLRVRVHGNLARIEVARGDMPLVIDGEIAARIANELKSLGYTYVTLDVQGYRMGSMNEPVRKDV